MTREEFDQLHPDTAKLREVLLESRKLDLRGWDDESVREIGFELANGRTPPELREWLGRQDETDAALAALPPKRNWRGLL